MLKIGLLATGDELVNGDVRNSNSQFFAEKLTDLGLLVGCHAVVTDTQADIESMLTYLLKQHDVIITTGGLGPTSDDRTRFAASQVTAAPLIFNEENWQTILARFQSIHLSPHHSNRQQALFPQNAEIIPNPKGTAAGFWMEHGKSLLFFLPGPPNECIPQFETIVIPKIQQLAANEMISHHAWRLFGVSEGEIAALLDQALQDYPLQTGYRYDYPYLEFKIRTTQSAILAEVLAKIDTLIKPYFLSHPKIQASQYLYQQLPNLAYRLIIHDEATGGLLQTTLLSPQTKEHVQFKPFVASQLALGEIGIHIEGLQAHWQNQMDNGNTHLKLSFFDINGVNKKTYQIPYRPKRVLGYAIEFIADKISRYCAIHAKS